MEVLVALPGGNRLEELLFNLGALATRDGKTVDANDWQGATAPNFTNPRAFGFPLLDFYVFAPGNFQVNFQEGTPAVVEAEPPALTFRTSLTFAGLGGTSVRQSVRLLGRFARLQVVDTSNAANNGIYLYSAIRGN